MTTTYVGADVHSATTTLCVRGSEGQILMETTVRTQGDLLVSFLNGIPGTVHLTFEEGTHAAWLYDLLRPFVADLLVCNPRANHNRGNKGDVLDARELSERLRGGFLKPVYHGEHGTRRLKELVRGRKCAVSDRTRAKNRLKALFRARGIPVSGKKVYQVAQRDHWLGQFTREETRRRATWLYRQLDLLDALVVEAQAAVLKESRKHRGWSLLRTIPGIGELRAAVLVAEMVTPFRFRTKRQLWSYVGLAVVTRSSADFKVVDGEIRKHKRTKTRGLTKAYNRTLKEVFKGAALDAIRGGLGEFYTRRLQEGMAADMARLTLARKIAAIALTIWKKGVVYDAEKAMMRT